MPVRRHRIGDQMPQVVHLGPDPAALALCQDLANLPDMESVILFGSRVGRGWDEQSDLDMIVIHPGAGDNEGKREVYRTLEEAKERYYPGYRDYESPHHGVSSGEMAVTPEDYCSHRRTLNDVMVRAAREGRIFTKDPQDEERYRHDGDVSNEWDLITLERLREAHGENGILNLLPRVWQPYPINKGNANTIPGRNAHGLLWHSGAALLSILGVIYPRTWVVELAESIAGHDAGWSHEFRSELERIDQYSGCGCEVVVTDPIDYVPALWRDLEGDRDALWGRIRELSGYDLASIEKPSGKAT